uniref:Uncharacterized protein n=1 Tax=Brassica oleracea var. oleracea TaxID=109376 RepID=A0A0D3A0L9_BRAOL
MEQEERGKHSYIEQSLQLYDQEVKRLYPWHPPPLPPFSYLVVAQHIQGSVFL